MNDSSELRALELRVAELTARVEQLEQVNQRLNAAASSPSEQISDPYQTPGRSTTAAPPPPAQIFEPTVPSSPESLERRIGSRWLNRIGVVALLVGVSYFLKLAFDTGWIGPGVRVLIGLTGGAGLAWWSERFRRSGAETFSYSLTAAGVGTMYLSQWAAFQLYLLVGGAVAFSAMFLLTLAVSVLAVRREAELLAALALSGGLLTPVLCSTGENHETVLFGYLLLLTLGALFVQRRRAWPRILFGAFAGSVALAVGWFNQFYVDAVRSETLVWFSLLFLVFASAPLLARSPEQVSGTARLSVLLLVVLNATAYFGAIYAQLVDAVSDPRPPSAAWGFGLALFYVGLGVAVERRCRELPTLEPQLPALHFGLAISFVTLAVALALREHWVTLAWLAEGALLFWTASRAARPGLRFLAVMVLLMGIGRLLTVDLIAWGVQPTLLNPRLATFAVAVAGLLAARYFERKAERKAEQSSEGEEGLWLALASVAVNALALFALGLEVHDYFWLAAHSAGADVRGQMTAANFSYSALLMLYGAGLMGVGFARRTALLRWQAMVLISAAVVKVFLVDVSELRHGWRVVSFLVLGALLLTISYGYQRDWLGLQSRRES